MSKETPAANQGPAKTVETVKQEEAPFTGILSKELLPEGVKQIKPFQKKFMYRGYEYSFATLTKRDIERFLAYSHNHWLQQDKKTDTPAKA